MQMKTAFIVLSMALVLLASCAPKTVPDTGKTVAEIDSTMSEVENLDKELDIESLDLLEAELAELDQIEYI